LAIHTAVRGIDTMSGVLNMKLSTKLTLMTAFLMVLTIITSIFVTLYYGNKIAEESISKKLNSSQLIQQQLNQQKLTQLELVSLLVASDPAFVAYVAQTIFDLENNEQADIASIADLLLERQQQYSFDVAFIVSADGQQIARSDRAMSAPRDLSSEPLMLAAMKDLMPVNGYWFDQEMVYQAAVVPLARGRNLIGFLITGLAINDQLSNDLAKLTGTEVVILKENNKQFSSLASTLDLDNNNDLITKLNQQQNLPIEDQFNLVINELNLANKLSQLTTINNNNYYFLNGISITQTMAPYIHTRNILIAIGISIVLLSLLIAKMFVNQSLSPLNKISASTRQVALGNYAATFPQKVGGDLNELSESVTQLAENLRGKDALAGHMIEMSKKSYKPTHSEKVIIEPGKVINKRFEVLKNIGIGGMGAVFKAFDRELEEVVAMKVLKTKTANQEEIAQFKDEIKIARRISHPNVVRIHDLGQLSNKVFISMEYVQGYTLEQILKYAKKLRPLAAKHAAIHICEGLQAAHDAGVVHKDLKPANIIVELDSSIKLMDFGIADIDSVISSSQSSDVISGTAAYIAPEQAMGKGSDERTDIYSLGILLMEMFIGQRPFYGTNDEELMVKHVEETPLPISLQWADAPKELERLINSCLAKSPKDRPQSVQLILNQLKQIKFKN